MARARRLCPTCRTQLTPDQRRCPTCRATSDRTRRPDGNPYGAAHRRFREQVLTRDPICVLCRRAWSTVADHHPHSRRDLTTAGLDPNNPTYGRGLCKPCHDRETARNQPGGWAARG